MISSNLHPNIYLLNVRYGNFFPAFIAPAAMANMFGNLFRHGLAQTHMHTHWAPFIAHYPSEFRLIFFSLYSHWSGDNDVIISTTSNERTKQPKVIHHRRYRF